MAKQAGKVWRQHGALKFHECVADDVPRGKRTSFPRSVKLKRSEIVVFSYIAGHAPTVIALWRRS